MCSCLAAQLSLFTCSRPNSAVTELFQNQNFWRISHGTLEQAEEEYKWKNSEGKPRLRGKHLFQTDSEFYYEKKLSSVNPPPKTTHIPVLVLALHNRLGKYPAVFLCRENIKFPILFRLHRMALRQISQQRCGSLCKSHRCQSPPWPASFQ